MILSIVGFPSFWGQCCHLLISHAKFQNCVYIYISYKFSLTTIIERGRERERQPSNILPRAIRVGGKRGLPFSLLIGERYRVEKIRGFYGWNEQGNAHVAWPSRTPRNPISNLLRESVSSFHTRSSSNQGKNCAVLPGRRTLK